MDDLPSDLSRVNSGVSCSRSRMMSASTTRTDERMNGIRQPYSRNAASPSVIRKNAMTARASTRPTVAVVWIQLVYLPRSWSGACSAT